MLARAFPALTLATGGAYSNALIEERNTNMQSNMVMTTKTVGSNTTTYWPLERKGMWLHSDIKKVAYPYLFGIFDTIVGTGGLK